MNLEFKYITVHCSASTPNGSCQKAADIDKMHRAKGWRMIGYHWVIRRDGTVEPGRPMDQNGAHVEDHNTGNLGICMIGGVSADAKLTPEDNFTPEQKASLLAKLKELRKAYPKAEILGHRDWPNVAKACPSFDVKSWLKANGVDPLTTKK